MTWNSGEFYFETTDMQPGKEFAFVLSDPSLDPLDGALQGGVFGWITLSSQCSVKAVFNFVADGMTPKPAFTVTTTQASAPTP